ncbi:hypothetical protein Asi02nite_13840 [Asanoa siamensis]|uniref:ATP-grasp domain-containing protein n=1 Tax=Asanoa siamensis TaxID=926357 RepID=A0ABQ4CKP1_9ACTN|nr:hypothetical protein Asi02nite_13840 [Asanoa siamensis]
MVIDASRQHEVLRWLDLRQTALIDAAGEVLKLESGCPGRGWLRRLAPAGWDRGVALGGHAAAVLSSRLSLLATLLRDPGLSWVTSVDALYAAENKLVQYRAALQEGVRVPSTMVSGSASDLADGLGEPFVLKPFGPGNFEDEGHQQVVHVHAVHAADVAEVELLDAPFIAQQVVHAHKHLRVVTVQDHAWVTELDATGLPLDWREHAPAHHAFTASACWPEVESGALQLAAALHVGFSSQDWVVDNDGPLFLDLNPGGQWLFLPDRVTTPIARALAGWLAGS